MNTSLCDDDDDAPRWPLVPLQLVLWQLRGCKGVTTGAERSAPTFLYQREAEAFARGISIGSCKAVSLAGREDRENPQEPAEASFLLPLSQNLRASVRAAQLLHHIRVKA